MKREKGSHARETSTQSRSGADVGSRRSRGRADRWEGREDDRHWGTQEEVPRGAAKPAPCCALRTWGSCRLRRGHSPYGHPVRGSEAQTGAALSGDTQRLCDNTTQRLLGDVVALPHHLEHCTITFCTATRAERTRDLQPNLPGRGRWPSLRLFPTQQPTKVLGWLAQEQPPCSFQPRSPSSAPIWPGHPCGEGL